MTYSIADIHEAWQNWKHNPVCKLSESELVRYLERFGDIEQSHDGGASWSTLPWKMKLSSQILRRFTNADWPPSIDCFGWYDGQIAIAWHDTGSDSEMHIGKYLAIFDEEKNAWKFKFLGFFNLEDGVHQTWFENIGFDALNRMHPLLAL